MNSHQLLSNLEKSKKKLRKEYSRSFDPNILITLESFDLDFKLDCQEESFELLNFCKRINNVSLEIFGGIRLNKEFIFLRREKKVFF